MKFPLLTADRNYTLTRAALRVGDFTASELESLSGARIEAVKSFLEDLEEGGGLYVTSVQLEEEQSDEESDRKRYTLTEQGISYLVAQSATVSQLANKSAILETVKVVSAKHSGGCLIGRSLVIKGVLHASESLNIDGTVVGSIEVPDNRITVGPYGEVMANLIAREVVILGKVQGKVYVSDRVDIRSQGSLIGDVSAQRISIEDGAFFKGGIDIRKPGQEKASQVKASSVSSVEAIRLSYKAH